MRASAIVVTYNSRAYLAACLASIERELGPQDELIVVDNGSTDGSADLVAACCPLARLIRGANIGYAGGNNQGALSARGEFLVFLNPDTTLAPGALAALLAPLEQPSDVALTAACVVHMHRPTIVNTCGNTTHYTGLAYCRGAGQPRARYAAPADVDAVSGAAFAIRRSVFEELGGFDEQFFMYVEDTDLSWRARLAGYRCRYAADAVVAHDYAPSYTPAKAFYLDRNRHLMLLKNLRRATYLRMLPGLLLAEVVTWGFVLLKGPRFWGVKPRVYGWLWAQRRAIRRARRATQSLRRRDDREVVGRMTYHLDFQQLAGRHLSRIAALAFHPAFWAARLLLDGGRA
jgi:GT2 family glycosyltransferase